MTKITQIAAALLALSPAILFAQPAAEPAPAPAAAAKPAAEAPKPVDPAKIALAQSAISALKSDRMFDNIPNYVKQMVSQNLALPPTATAEEKKKAQDAETQAVDFATAQAKEMKTRMAETYAQLYSDDELKAIHDFFSSPAGEALMTKQAQVNQHMGPAMQQMQRDIMQKIQQLIAEAKPQTEAPKAEAPKAEAAKPTEGPKSAK